MSFTNLCDSHKKEDFCYFSYAGGSSEADITGSGGWLSLVAESVSAVCRAAPGVAVSSSLQNCHRPCGTALVQGLLFQGQYLTKV